MKKPKPDPGPDKFIELTPDQMVALLTAIDIRTVHGDPEYSTYDPDRGLLARRLRLYGTDNRKKYAEIKICFREDRTLEGVDRPYKLTATYLEIDGVRFE